MIRTRKLFRINKTNNLTLDEKYEKSLEYLISALNDWGYQTPKTLDIFLNELKQFIEIDKIYLNDIENFFNTLTDDEILEYAWEVETLSSIRELFKIFDSTLELSQIFDLVSDYFENKSSIVIKNLEGKIIVRASDKKEVEKILLSMGVI